MDWRFSLFLLSLFGLLIGFTWGTSEGGMCSAPYVVGVLADHTKDGALNCFEFWFNRYQGLFAGILSLASALIAAWLVWKQLFGMNAANEISRRAQAVSQYESVQRRYKALRSAGSFGNQVQSIAKLADNLAMMIKAGQIEGTAIDNYNADLVERCNRALADASRLNETLECGPSFSKRILSMEFDCDHIKFNIVEYRGCDGDLLDVGSKEHFCWMLSNSAGLMIANSISYFQWSISEINRLEKLMEALDDIIIEGKR